LFAVVMVVVKLTQQYAPAGGIYLVAAIAGLTDVDAITLSLAQNTRNGFSYQTAAIAIAVAAASNTLVKCGMVLVLGHARLRLRLVMATAVLLSCGAIAAVLL
jgi:uncharacterized membrane protein (DUF4010 family)